MNLILHDQPSSDIINTSFFLSKATPVIDVHCLLADGDWVALSSPMMKVEVLDDTEAPSVCTAANSNREDDYVISVLDGTEAPSLCTASNSNDGEEDYVSSVLDGIEARSHCAIANSEDGEENYVSSMILSHESLKTKSVTSASGIDPTKKEVCISSSLLLSCPHFSL